MNVDSEEVSDYIKGVVEGVKKGIPSGHALSSPIRFRLGLRNVGGREGFLKIMIAGIGGSRSRQENAEIEFEVADVTPEGIKNIALTRMATQTRPPKESR